MDKMEYMDYWDDAFFEDAVAKPESTFYQTYHLCIIPTLYEIFPHIWKLLALNIIFRLCTQIKPIRRRYNNMISSICGLAVLFLILRSTLLYIIYFTVYCRTALRIAQSFRSNGSYFVGLSCIVYLVISEFYFPLPQAWNETRGLHMIFAMKVISVAFDMKKGIIKNYPDIYEFYGYLLCPSNCLFGPWISLSTYRSVFTCFAPFDLRWICRVLVTSFLAIIFLMFSNCVAYWLIPQTSKWFVAYQEAFSFRSSHYFISYLSEAAMIAGGFGYTNLKRRQDYVKGTYVITYPLSIELPRSLVQVVVHWNIPMHTWLKTYVFQVAKPFGSFCAVIMTYITSSFLHGFNLRLAAVLLSLGFYTYIEYKLRRKLSIIFSACCAANPCEKSCEHRYKNKHCLVLMTNFIFSIMAVFHLAYLGCLLETTSDTYDNNVEIFSKWTQLDYASHLLLIFLYLVYKLM